MSELAPGGNGNSAQCFPLPVTGSTGALVLSATSATSGPLAEAGVYRLESNIYCQVVAGPLALTTDMPLRADIVEYFYIKKGQSISAIAAAAGALEYTLMPNL